MHFWNFIIVKYIRSLGKNFKLTHELNIPRPFIKSILLSVLISLSFACAKKSIPTITAQDEDPVVGNDVDDNGCIGTAGYQWSKVRKECIRIFELGIEMINAQDQNASLVCYLVRSIDNESFEAFIPNSADGIILHKIEGHWTDENGRFVLKFEDDENYELFDSSGTLLYKSN